MTALIRSVRRLAPHAVLLPAALAMVYPFFWMVRASLRTSAEVFGAVPDAPPTLGILYFRSQDGGNDFGPLMASATLVTLPMIALFLALQRQFVRGVTMSGVK